MRHASGGKTGDMLLSIGRTRLETIRRAPDQTERHDSSSMRTKKPAARWVRCGLPVVSPSGTNTPAHTLDRLRPLSASAVRESTKFHASLGQRIAELADEILRCFYRVEMHCHCRRGRPPQTILRESPFSDDHHEVVLDVIGPMRPCRRIQPS